MEPSKQVLTGIGVFCLTGALIVSWSLLANVPYADYGSLKSVVAGASFLGAYVTLRSRPVWWTVGLLMVVSGFVALIGKMPREEWASVNEASLVLLLIATVLSFWQAYKTEEE